MKSNYSDPSEWLSDVSKVFDKGLKQKRLEAVTNEYIGDTVTADGIVPYLSGDLRLDIQAKSVPKNGMIMTNKPYAQYVNEKNVTGVPHYLDEMWKRDEQSYRDMYAELLDNDLNNI